MLFGKMKRNLLLTNLTIKMQGPLTAMRHLPTWGHAFRASHSRGLWPYLVYSAVEISISVTVLRATEQVVEET